MGLLRENLVPHLLIVRDLRSNAPAVKVRAKNIMLLLSCNIAGKADINI